MVEVAAPIKDDFFNALFQGPLGDERADFLCCLDVSAIGAEVFLLAVGGYEGYAVYVIDDLGVNIA